MEPAVVVRIHPGQLPCTRGPRARARLLAALAALALQPAAVLAAATQDRTLPTAVGAVSPRDSASLRSDARGAQRTFERTRVRHLPLTWAGGGWSCDEIVGRMCWRHDDTDEDYDWEPEPEAEAIRVARDTLLLRLDRIGERIPGDDWVLGQRVWYRGEADRWGEALGLAAACRGGHDGWCAALEGTALHHLGRYEDAEAAFARAGRAMDGERTAEEALRLLLDSEARDWLEEGLRAEEDAAEGRAPGHSAREALIWAMADPLWGEPGNDRLTAHQARRTLDLVRRNASNPYGLPWGDDTAELQIRYGWEAAWERDQTRSMVGTGSPRVIGRHAPRSRRYVPAGRVLRSPATADTAELAPFRRRPQSAYSPPYARDVIPATGQVLAVRREASGSLVWAILDEDPEMDEVTISGAFALDLASLAVREADSLAPGVYGIEVPYGGHVLSVEEWGSGEPQPTVRRLRRGILTERLPPDVLAVSDLLVLTNGPLPEGLDGAAARVLRQPPAPGDTVVIAWTVHGLGFDGAELGYSLTTDADPGGLLRRLGRWMRVVQEEPSVLTEWSEPQPPDPGPVFRSVRLVLPEWESGTHILTLTLTAAGRAAVVSRSALRLRASSPEGP